MKHSDDDGHDAGDDDATRARPFDLEGVLAELLERYETDGEAAVEEVCSRHPDHSRTIRRAISDLVRAGLAGTDPGGTGEPEPRLPGVPERLDDFEIVREIGRGGMGVVFEARQLSLGRHVALKVLPSHLSLDQQTVERFKREGQAAAKLQHRNIVQVHSVGSSGGHHYHAMELVEGAPLDAVVERLRGRDVGRLTGEDVASVVASVVEPLTAESSGGARSPVSRVTTRSGSHSTVELNPWMGGHVQCAVALCAQIADALSCAHAGGVVHRDVKPSNVMVRPDGTALLTDFGLARLGDLPGLTRTGAFAGTPNYTAPEQVAGAAAVDERADVFSLGATLYELLTLCRPFEGRTTQDILARIQSRDPVEPTRRNPQVPPDLSAVVMKALEKERERRYASAAELAQDLRAVLRFQPVTARRASTAARLRRWVRREPLKAALVGLLVVGVPALAALGGHALASRPLVVLAEQETRRQRAEQALLEGYLLGKRGEPALAAFRSGLAEAPDDAELIAAAACAMSSLGQVDDALEWLRARSDELGDPRLFDWARAACLLLAGRDAEAAALEQRLGTPTRLLDLTMASLNITARAQRAHDFVAFREAEQLLLRAVMLSPRPRPHVLYRLAMVTTYTHDKELARSVAAAFEELWPETPYVLEAKGLALSEFDPERAVEAYQKVLAQRPDLMSVRINLGGVLYDLGQTERAIELAREIPEGDPQYSAAQYQLGRIAFNEGDMAGAETAWRASIAADPDNVASKMGLGNVLARRGDHDEVIALLEPVTRRFPRVARAHNNLASAWMEKGELEKALPILDEAIRQDPAYAYPHSTKGEALAKLGRWEEARASYERAVQVEPRNPGRWWDLVVFLIGKDTPAAQRDPRTAVRAARRLVELTRDDYRPARYALGKALLAAGREAEGRSELERLRVEVGDSDRQEDVELRDKIARLLESKRTVDDPDK